MRKKYIYSSRHTRTAKLGTKKHKPKFPKLLQETIKKSDIILEILDARFINETRNKEIEKEIKQNNKIQIFVINKSDLIDINKTKREIELNQIEPHIFISAKSKKSISKLREKIKILSKKIRKLGKIQIGVIGYPNTGKSSIINVLIGKHSTKTSSQSGHTKGIQHLKLSQNIQIIDTPGVIPESEYSTTQKQKLQMHAKFSARDYSKVKDPELLVNYLMEDYHEKLEKFYKIQTNNNSETLIEKLGRKLNLLKKGDQVDTDRTARKILKDWQEGKI